MWVCVKPFFTFRLSMTASFLIRYASLHWHVRSRWVKSLSNLHLCIHYSNVHCATDWYVQQRWSMNACTDVSASFVCWTHDWILSFFSSVCKLCITNYFENPTHNTCPTCHITIVNPTETLKYVFCIESQLFGSSQWSLLDLISPFNGFCTNSFHLYSNVSDAMMVLDLFSSWHISSRWNSLQAVSAISGDTEW